MLFMLRLSDVRVVLRRRDRERSTPPLWPNVIAVQIEALQCHVHLGPSG